MGEYSILVGLFKLHKLFLNWSFNVFMEKEV
jgi:hypothetical protein